MKIGFVGLGSMGAPMAKNLVAAEFDVTVFDLDAARMAGLQKVGARIASSLTELAADVDVLMTSLPGPKQSRLAMPPVLALLKRGGAVDRPDDRRSRTRAGTRQHCKGARDRHARVTGDGGGRWCQEG